MIYHCHTCGLELSRQEADEHQDECHAFVAQTHYGRDDLRKPCTACDATGICANDTGYLEDCDICGGRGQVW